MPLLICLIYKVPMRFSHQWVSQHLCINSDPLCCCFDAERQWMFPGEKKTRLGVGRGFKDLKRARDENEKIGGGVPIQSLQWKKVKVKWVMLIHLGC